MDHDTATEAELIRRTRQLISLPALQALHQAHEGLSGLFLPSVPAGYLDSSKRLMLVGQETRRWNGGQSIILASKDMSSYLQSSQLAHWKHWLEPKGVGRSAFLGFLGRCKQQVEATEGLPAVIWANLFCMSHENRSPRSSTAFEQITALSKASLLLQVQLLRPTHILFVTGPGYDKYIKQFFTITNSRVITPRRLWQFSANSVPAWRTPHPRHRASDDARRQALALVGQPGSQKIST